MTAETEERSLKDKVTDVLWAVALPFLIQRTLEWVASTQETEVAASSAVHVWWRGPLETNLRAVAELFHVWWILGIGMLFLRHVSHEVLMPGIKKIVDACIVPAIGSGFSDLRTGVRDGLSAQGLPIQTEVTASKANDYIGADAEVAEAKKAMVDGRVGTAIKLLRALVAKDPKHRQQLLRAMLLSAEHARLPETEELLSAVGEPLDYLRYAYWRWTEGQTLQAIRLVETALERLPGDGDPVERSKFENTLAYYYADAKVGDRAAVALSLVESAIATLPKESRSQGSYLATRGYVKITFGDTQETIADGITDCEEGRRKGARLDLYYRHLARAQERSNAMLT